MASNANVRQRSGPARASPNSVLVYTPDPATKAWAESELSGQPVMIRFVPSVAEIVRALVDDPPPLPQVLIADFDAMKAADVLHLHGIRERGWFGSIIALGEVAGSLKTSLNVERVLARPLGANVLRSAVSRIGLDLPTTKIPKIK